MSLVVGYTIDILKRQICSTITYSIASVYKQKKNTIIGYR